MNPRRLAVLVLLVAPLLAGAADTPVKAKAAAVAAEPPPPESTLKQAMPAAEVLKVMGKPASVAPMEDPGGKAEVWTYLRKLNPRVVREPVASTPIMVEVQGGDGKMHKYQQGDNVQFGDVHYYTEETVQLLMFNGKFVVCKVGRREVKQLQ